MKAMIYHEYGSPENLEFAEIELPVVKDNEVLVKVLSASVNWLDWHFLTGAPFMVRLMAGLLKPKHNILGIDVAGTVEAVGENVSQFHPGDEVFGATSHGCFAEYVCVSETEVVSKPANITFEESAAVPGAAFPALQGLRSIGQITSGHEVLIYGASGGLGTFAVQISKSFGAEVTGVCSTRNLEMVHEIGAHHVIDYTQEDFTQKEQRFDLIFDTVAKCSFADCQRVLKPDGIYVTTDYSPWLALRGMWMSMTRTHKMVPLAPKPPSQRDLIFMKDLLESGKITSIIDRKYSLDELPDALRYLKNGHARGKIVVTTNPLNSPIGV